MTPLAFFLQTITSQIGKEEVPRGSNWGDDVKGYLNSVGIDFPASWCMALVYWCADKTAKQFSIPNPLLKTGGVMRQWNERPNLRVTKPQVGDVFIMDFGKGLGHTGVVEFIEGDKIHTIEGNTNDEGSREGYEVCKRVRPIAKMKGFLRPFTNS